MLLIAISVHSMFDFDLQFVVIGFILILAMDLESGKTWRFYKKMQVQITVGILILCNCWLGIAMVFYHCGKYKMAVTTYPGYTAAWIEMLAQAKDEREMEQLANEILDRNESVALAYSAKARLAYSEGDFEQMIDYKKQALFLARYELEEYLDYFDMLYTGIYLYEEAGDRDSAEYCKDRLFEISKMIDTVIEESDELAFQIRDKPKLELPEEYQEILDKLQ